MRQQTVKVNKTVEIPEGYMLVPDDFEDVRITFNTPTESLTLRTLLRGELPFDIGPFRLAWNEAGGAMYELQLEEEE